jgi:hypothetical protein
MVAVMHVAVFMRLNRPYLPARTRDDSPTGMHQDGVADVEIDNDAIVFASRFWRELCHE